MDAQNEAFCVLAPLLQIELLFTTIHIVFVLEPHGDDNDEQGLRIFLSLSLFG